MTSLLDFSTVHQDGEMPICENNGRLCTLPVAEIDAVITTLVGYPEIVISRDILHASTSNVYWDDRRAVLLPVNEPTLKRVWRIWRENGLSEALQETASITNESDPQYRKQLLATMSYVLKICLNIQRWFGLQPKFHGFHYFEHISETRDWTHSLIRFICWHPQYFKIAVASLEDTIRVYGEDPLNFNILKNYQQKSVTSLAWRPFTAGELAVGCELGTLLWTIDPNSYCQKPLTQVILLQHGQHYPIVSVEWNQCGTLLATASTNSSDILIWDVDRHHSVPLKRVGQPCTLLKWSPDGMHLCSSTVSQVFRVWSTVSWRAERWTLPKGSLLSSAWSPCGAYLLFVTTNDSYLYSLKFVEEHIFNCTATTKQALPIADLSNVTIDHKELGGQPQCIVWDARGRHLAVMFKHTSSIAIFLTNINRHAFTLAPSYFVSANLSLMGTPSLICFKPIYKGDPRQQSVLTIGWSCGSVQFFPFD